MTSKYFCKICDVDYDTWQDYANHQHKVKSPVSRYASDLHLAKGIPFCKVCSLRFDTVGQMLGHVEKHEKERKIVPRNVLQSDEDDDDKFESNNNAVDVKALVLLDRSGKNVNVERLEALSKQLLSEKTGVAMDEKAVEEEDNLRALKENTLNRRKWAKKFVDDHLNK